MNIWYKVRVSFLLLLSPACIFISWVLLKFYWGPYWESNDYDPQYTYLLNGLNIATGQPIGHVDHPGATLQHIIGWGLIIYQKIKGLTRIELIDAVLKAPESFISIFVIVPLVLNLLIFYIGSMALYFRTNAKIHLLLFQVYPFASSLLILYGTTKLAPETFLMGACFILSFLLIAYLVNPENRVKIIYMMGICIGFGLANKLTLAPALIIPLLLVDGARKKGLVMGIIILSFIIFAYPISVSRDYYNYVTRALLAIFSSSPQYSSYALKKWSLMEFALNIFHIFIYNFIYLIVQICSIVVLIFRKQVFEGMKDGATYYKVLWVLVLFEWLHLVMISASLFMPQYTVAGLGLMGVNLFVFSNLAYHLSVRRIYTFAFGGLIFLNIIVNITYYQAQAFNSKEGWKEQRQVDTILSRHSDYAQIFYYKSNSKAAGLINGDIYTSTDHHHVYGTELKRLFPNYFFYYIFNSTYYDFEQQISLDKIKATYGNKILYIGTTPSFYGKPDRAMEIMGKPSLPFGANKRLYKGLDVSITIYDEKQK